MTENEHTKPIEPWQIALQLKHQQAVANTIRTGVRMLARQTNAEALSEELEMIQELADELHEEIGALRDRIEE